MKFSNRSIQRPKVMAFLAGLGPAILLAWRGQHQHLGANPVEVITHATGKLGGAVQGVFYVAPIAPWDKRLVRQIACRLRCVSPLARGIGTKPALRES